MLFTGADGGSRPPSAAARTLFLHRLDDTHLHPCSPLEGEGELATVMEGGGLRIVDKRSDEDIA